MTAFFHKYYMNLAELNNFNLGDTVKFHDKLNPALFDGDRLKKDVRELKQAIIDIRMELRNRPRISENRDYTEEK